MEYIIYKIINHQNNKVYIGQTTNLKERRRAHRQAPFNKKGRDYEKPLYRAIRKYGLDNFTMTVIDDTAKNMEELNEKEIYYIKKYNSCIDSGLGYNLELGGHNGLKSQYIKDKISKAHKGYGGGSFGKRKGDAYRARKIICLETGKVYPSAIDCAEDLFPENIKSARKQISKCANPRFNRFTYKGYSLRFVDDNGKTIPKQVDKIPISRNLKGVKVINLDTKQIFNSIKEASEFYEVSYGMIRDRVYGRVKDENLKIMIYEDFIANEEA